LWAFYFKVVLIICRSYFQPHMISNQSMAVHGQVMRCNFKRVITPLDFLYIWEKYRTFEITSAIILKTNLPLYKGFTLEITNKWWPLTTLNRWPLYWIKIYSKMHRESTKVTDMSRWPLYKCDRYDRFDCISQNTRS
jgi:hypothetical protein